MTLRCIIVDDEPTARNILKKYVAEVPVLQLLGECKHALEALDFLQQQEVDLIFLDIEMPKLSGLNLAKIIDQQLKIIFTTAHREFALEGFELNAVDYLLKPFSFERFLKAVQKIAKVPTTPAVKNAGEFIYIKADKKMMRIALDELLYIEGLSNYIKINIPDKTIVAYKKMSEMVNELPAHFLRTHKSFIVNTTRITAYTNRQVEIGDIQIPVSTTYRNQLMSVLNGLIP